MNEFQYDDMAMGSLWGSAHCGTSLQEIVPDLDEFDTKVF